jgi:hypothetical protein
LVQQFASVQIAPVRGCSDLLPFNQFQGFKPTRQWSDNLCHFMSLLPHFMSLFLFVDLMADFLLLQRPTHVLFHNIESICYIDYCCLAAVAVATPAPSIVAAPSTTSFILLTSLQQATTGINSKFRHGA